MYQNEIKYFWPLTEQIDLGLDFTPCNEYDEEKRRQYFANSILCNPNGNLLVGSTNSFINPNTIFTTNGEERMRISSEGIMMLSGGSGKVGYWAIGDSDFRIYRNKKPNWLSRNATQLIFGWKWNDEC